MCCQEPGCNLAVVDTKLMCWRECVAKCCRKHGYNLAVVDAKVRVVVVDRGGESIAKYCRETGCNPVLDAKVRVVVGGSASPSAAENPDAISLSLMPR